MGNIKISEGGSKTPAKVMGSQGSPAKIPASYSEPKATKSTSFDSMNTSKPAGKLVNHDD